MKICIVIPAHNEEEHIGKTLQSLVEQTLRPTRLVVVNDNSTDNTQSIIDKFSKNYGFITSVNSASAGSHQPGSKVINAFYKGYETLNEDFDIICKFDADLIFPENYLEEIKKTFNNHPECGMTGGFCYIEKNNNWVLENLTNKDHIRGALKAYRKECFASIGGIKKTMGWDTVDELLAKYHGWRVITLEQLQVKHLKPTGATYSKKAKHKQGEVFYKLRYGIVLTRIASLKLALKKNNLGFYWDCMNGYRLAKKNGMPFLVSEEEGEFIRDLRWKNIKGRLKP